MIVETITVTEANAALVEGHYLGEIGYQPSVILAEREGEKIIAVAVYAPPTPQHFKKKLPGCLELTRLWQSEDRRERRLEFGALSMFVKATLAWLREHRPDVPCVFSYTDPSVSGPNGKHHGAVYHAARFKCLGPSRVTDEWRDPITDEKLSAPVCFRRYHTKSREYLSGTAPFRCKYEKCRAKPKHEHVGPGLVLIEKPPKILFVYGLALKVAAVRSIIGGRYAIGNHL